MTSKDEGYNFRAINAAFDTMLKEENRSPYEAGFLTMMYAAWLVEDQMGRATRIQLIENVREELEKAKAGELTLPELSDEQRQDVLARIAITPDDNDVDFRRTILPMLQHLTTDLKAAHVPDVELPPVLVDYAGMLALALAEEAGLETIITRLEGMLDDYRHRRPPFASKPQ